MWTKTTLVVVRPENAGAMPNRAMDPTPVGRSLVPRGAGHRQCVRRTQGSTSMQKVNLAARAVHRVLESANSR
jgi:hypothetical protein